MSKYNLTDIYKQVLNESMSRGGIIDDSFYNIANLADELDGENVGKDTYPIRVQRLGPSLEGKTNEEISIRYGDGHKDYFHIYDYKFGEDPTSEENFRDDYPFSLGIPTGNKDGKQWATKLGFKVRGMNEGDSRPGYKSDGTPKSNDEMDDDEREDFYMNLDSVDENKELKEHFNRFK